MDLIARARGDGDGAASGPLDDRGAVHPEPPPVNVQAMLHEIHAEYDDEADGKPRGG